MIRPALFSLCLLVFANALAAGEPPLLADPTQPPAGVGGGFGATAGRLSSIVLPKKGKASAVIDGQLTIVGGMVGEARLVRLSESEAVLEGPEGVERLFLTPDVDKKMNVTKAAARRKKE